MSVQILPNHPTLSKYFQYEYQLHPNQLAAGILASIALYVDFYSIAKPYEPRKLQFHDMNQALNDFFYYIKDCKSRFDSLQTEPQIQNLALMIENPLLAYKNKNSIYVSKLINSIASIFGVIFKIISEDSYKVYGTASNQPFHLFIYKNNTNYFTLFPIDYSQLTDHFLDFIKFNNLNLASCGHSLSSYSKTSNQCTTCKRSLYELEKKYSGQVPNSNNICKDCKNKPVITCKSCNNKFCSVHSSTNICSVCKNMLKAIPPANNINNYPHPVDNQIPQNVFNYKNQSSASNNISNQNNILDLDGYSNDPNNLINGHQGNDSYIKAIKIPVLNKQGNFIPQGLHNDPFDGLIDANNPSENFSKYNFEHSHQNKPAFVQDNDPNDLEILIDTPAPKFKYNWQHFGMFYQHGVRNYLQNYQFIIDKEHSIKLMLKLFLSYQSNRNIISKLSFHKHTKILNQMKTLIQNNSKANFGQLPASIKNHISKRPKNQNFQPEHLKILKAAFLFSTRIIITGDKKLVFGPKTKLSKLWIVFIDASQDQILIRIKNPKHKINARAFNKEEKNTNEIVDKHIDQTNDEIKNKKLEVLSLICGCKKNSDVFIGRGFLALKDFRCNDHQEKLHSLEIEFIEKNVYRNRSKCAKCGSINGKFISCKKCKLMYCDSECVDIREYLFQNQDGDIKCPNCQCKLKLDELDNGIQIDLIGLGFSDDKIQVNFKEIFKQSAGNELCKNCKVFRVEGNNSCRLCAQKKKP